MHSLSHIYVHLVFSTKMRVPFILPEFREETEKYLSSIIKAKECLLIQQFLMPDHYHGLIRLSTTETVANLVQALKGSSARWLNAQTFKGAFSWQTGYGAFSHMAGDLDGIIRYIQMQPDHHKSMSLESEAERLSKKYKAPWILD